MYVCIYACMYRSYINYSNVADGPVGIGWENHFFAKFENNLSIRALSEGLLPTGALVEAVLLSMGVHGG